MGLIDSLRDTLTAKSSVQMVADDPQLAAEILLLVRVMFADGELAGSELALFKGLCAAEFNIPEDDVPEVIRFLKDISYETTGVQAASMFEHMPDARKEAVLGHVISMARADLKLDPREVDFISRISSVLGYDPEKIKALL